MTEMREARLLDGAAVAGQIYAEATRQAEAFSKQTGRKPCLAAVLIGDDPASVTYVRMKQRRCEEVGIEPRLVRLPVSATTAEAADAVESLSNDETVDGILVQHPAPPQVDERTVFERIAPAKDVDGVTMHSFAAMAFGLPGPHSCTPGGIMQLLDAYDIDPAGKHAVVIGRSAILGKPMGMLLLARNATVTYCHSRTRDLPSLVSNADILVAAVGSPRFVQGDWIKPGAVVIDAGYNPGNVGDVDFDAAAAQAGYITPVPGGVGPMTIAVLVAQTVAAAETSRAREG